MKKAVILAFILIATVSTMYGAIEDFNSGGSVISGGFYNLPHIFYSGLKSTYMPLAFSLVSAVCMKLVINKGSFSFYWTLWFLLFASIFAISPLYVALYKHRHLDAYHQAGLPAVANPIQIPCHTRVLWAASTTDMRKRFSGLAALAEHFPPGSLFQSYVWIPRPAWRSAQNNPVELLGYLPIHKAAREGPFCLAVSGQWLGLLHSGTIVAATAGDRLADISKILALATGRMM